MADARICHNENSRQRSIGMKDFGPSVWPQNGYDAFSNFRLSKVFYLPYLSFTINDSSVGRLCQEEYLSLSVLDWHPLLLKHGQFQYRI